MPLRQSTTKTPFGWTDADSNNYSFKQWKRDLNLWCISTELNDAQIAPAVVQRLGCMAREIGLNLAEIRSTNHTTGAVGSTLQYGANVDLGDGMKRNSGIDILIHNLSYNFGALPQEAQLKVMIAFFQFRRLPGEAADTLLCRWEQMRVKAEGGVQMSWTCYSFLILCPLVVPLKNFPNLLIPLSGKLTTTREQYDQLIHLLRQNEHYRDPTMLTTDSTASFYEDKEGGEPSELEEARAASSIQHGFGRFAFLWSG